MKQKTDWDKKIEKKDANLGFITKLDAFYPSDTKKAIALEIEINSWQKSIGKKTYTVSGEYSVPKGHGFDLKVDYEESVEASFTLAKIAYVYTPMDPEHKLTGLAAQVVKELTHPPSTWQKTKSWVLNKFRSRRIMGPLGLTYKEWEAERSTIQQDILKDKK